MNKKIPLILIYLRLIFGIIILFLAYIQWPGFIQWIVMLIIAGFLSDIFDGIIARRLGVSSIELRKLDSIVDRIFWLLVVATCVILYPEFMESKLIVIGLVLGLEFLVFSFCLLKFKRIPSPHNFLSKLWGVAVVVALVDIIINGSSILIFDIMIALGLVSRMDSLLIHVLLNEWDHDIPSSYHAYLIRIGKPLKKNDLLNG